jgi:hypothetical protein
MVGFGAVALTGAAGLLLSRRYRAGGVLMAAAGVAVVVAAGARVDCPFGAAGCAAGPGVVPADLTSQVHAAAVVASQVLLSGALVAVAWRARRQSATACALAAGAGAVLTAVLALDPLLLEPGWSQRLWVASGHLALLAVWGVCRPLSGIGSGHVSGRRRGAPDAGG